MKASLLCPHCDVAIDLRTVKHEGWFAPHRLCPECGNAFEVDGDTKRRQSWLLIVLGGVLMVTFLATRQGGVWWIATLISCLVTGVLIYHGNRKIRLVKSFRKDSKTAPSPKQRSGRPKRPERPKGKG